ncbi:MAG: hypothetical protein AB1568_04670 [Thermodesulfobacteriota bacterium]
MHQRRLLSNHHRLFACLAWALMMLLSGCVQVKSPTDMSPQDLAVWANRVYIAEYDSYMLDIKQPNIPAPRRDLLRKKRQLLNELYQPLNTLNQYLETGALPEKQVTQQVIDIVTKLMEKQ